MITILKRASCLVGMETVGKLTECKVCPVGFRDRVSTVFKHVLRWLLTTIRAFARPLKYIIGAYLCWRAWRILPASQSLRTNIMQWWITNSTLRPEFLRGTFTSLPLTEMKMPGDHTHPIAAADRSAASNFVDRYSRAVGLQAFYYQRSRADERNHRLGSRAWYWAKDFITQPEPMTLPERPLMVMVDVDQYVDMPKFLCDHPVPTLVYTFQPDQVSKVSTNYSYTFSQDDEVTYNVTGGGYYQHKVWNYSADHFSAQKTFLGIPYKTAHYLVDRRQTSPDHELILLTPMCTVRGLGSILVMKWVFSRVLERLRVATPGGFARLRTSSLAGVKVSTGRVGSYLSATIPVIDDDTIAAVARTSQYKLTMPQVLAFTRGDRPQASALLEYHQAKVPDVKIDVVCPVGQGARRYQFDPGNYDPTVRPSMVAFMTPMVHEAFCPDRTVGNEVRCIEERVERFQRILEVPMTTFISLTMAEFAEQLIPPLSKESLDPVDYDHVLMRQSRVTQRHILAQAEALEPNRIVLAFQKNEAYAAVKDPRLISTINGVDKREYSMFLYSFEQVMKVQPWYAFGRKPKEIAERVVEVVATAQFVAMTDFSRFDGHGSTVMRELERQVLMRAFRPQYHAQLAELHKSQYNLRGFGRRGTRYETGYARASGSPETSLFNTFVNAFVSYLALRMTKGDNGLYYTPGEAYQRLGIYGGDDGLTADTPPDILKKAAVNVGQELTIEPIARGSMGVQFLARVYSPDVWFGDLNSCCDLPRQLGKLHVTIALNSKVTPVMKLLEKVRGFAMTDINTPIMGDFCQRVMRVHLGDIEPNTETEPMRQWLTRFEQDVQYKNEAASWMMDYVEKKLPEFEYKRFLAWLVQADTYEKLLSPPLFQEPSPAKPTAPVVVDGDVHPIGAVVVPIPPRPEHAGGVEYKDGKVDSKGLSSFVAGTFSDATPAPIVPYALPVTPVILTPEAKLAAERKARYEEVKQRKLAKGTWIERPDEKRGAVVRTGKIRPSYEELKARKIRDGTWVENPTNTRGAQRGRGRGRGSATSGNWRAPPRGRGH